VIGTLLSVFAIGFALKVVQQLRMEKYYVKESEPVAFRELDGP
jgi:hypothetical protein